MTKANRTSLTLTRRIGESVMIGSNVTVEIAGYRGMQVMLRITAPAEVAIDRQEIRERKLAERGFDPGRVA